MKSQGEAPPARTRVWREGRAAISSPSRAKIPFQKVEDKKGFETSACNQRRHRKDKLVCRDRFVEVRIEQPLALLRKLVARDNYDLRPRTERPQALCCFHTIEPRHPVIQYHYVRSKFIRRAYVSA